MFLEKLLNLGTSVTDLKDHWVTVDKDLIFVPEKNNYRKWNRSRTTISFNPPSFRLMIILAYVSLCQKSHCQGWKKKFNISVFGYPAKIYYTFSKVNVNMYTLVLFAVPQQKPSVKCFGQTLNILYPRRKLKKKKKHRPLFPTPGAPITASLTSDRVDFFRRTWSRSIWYFDKSHMLQNYTISPQKFYQLLNIRR